MQEVKKYEKKYTVKSYEVDCNGFLRIVSLMNFLQDIATENAELLGLGLEDCRKLDLSWVGSDYLIDIIRMPRLHETIKIVTWPAEGKLWGAIRDFVVFDASSEIIMKASSQWVLIDFVRRRPVALQKHFPQYQCLNERILPTDFPKIEATDNGSLKEFHVRFDDIDVNNHVNNTIYPVWASEGIDKDFRCCHIPAQIQISYKKEALLGRQIVVSTVLEGNESKHLIFDKDSADRLALCRIKWVDITS